VFVIYTCQLIYRSKKWFYEKVIIVFVAAMGLSAIKADAQYVRSRPGLVSGYPLEIVLTMTLSGSNPNGVGKMAAM